MPVATSSNFFYLTSNVPRSQGIRPRSLYRRGRMGERSNRWLCFTSFAAYSYGRSTDVNAVRQRLSIHHCHCAAFKTSCEWLLFFGRINLRRRKPAEGMSMPRCAIACALSECVEFCHDCITLPFFICAIPPFYPRRCAVSLHSIQPTCCSEVQHYRPGPMTFFSW